MLLENMKLALAAIRANKMRSILTMLGIIIGISSVISIVSIGESMKAIMADQWKTIGVNRVMVYVNDYENQRESDFFTLDEMAKVKKTFPSEIAYIDPGMTGSGDAINGRNKLKIDYNGVGAGYALVQPTKMLYGRMINMGDVNSGKDNAVLEEAAAIKLFGTANAVGKNFRSTMNGKTVDFTVVGVYQKEVSAMEALMSSMGNGERGSAFLPYTQFIGQSGTTFALNIYLANSVDQATFNSTLCEYVAKQKGREPEQVMVDSAKDQMGMMNNIMSILSLAVGAIAAISLLVGGIGIMNIMLVSVTERTREIGIRKALGARTGDVLVQFLTESALISIAGGIIGIILGVGTVALGGLILHVGVVISPLVVICAVAFSGLVGIFFGIYPASKAAKADPIIALRYE